MTLSAPVNGTHKETRLVWTNVVVELRQLKPWPRNPRQSTRKQAAALLDSWDKFGQVQLIIIDPDFTVIDGHQRLDMLLDAYGPKFKAEARQSNRPLTDREHEEFVITLHAGAVGEWNWDELANWEGKSLIGWGLDPAALKGWKRDANAIEHLIESEKEAPPDDPGADIDRAAELREKWNTETGQLWQLGEHRIICGDCTDPAVVDAVMDGERADAVVTDPPYCSGGFQEAGKNAGSVGTRGSEMIARDTLSTRGYISLMRRAINLSDAGLLHIFTDWRMWVNLFDVVESQGYGVRNMVVWDKGSPGMGRGWRSQHELVMIGSRVSQAFDPKQAQGNVIQADRTGNKNHATEKPVDLIETMLKVADMTKCIYDPFLGSGTTLIACERLNRRCRGIEISPAYIAVTLERWSDMTGETPELARELAHG